MQALDFCQLPSSMSGPTQPRPAGRRRCRKLHASGRKLCRWCWTSKQACGLPVFPCVWRGATATELVNAPGSPGCASAEGCSCWSLTFLSLHTGLLLTVSVCNMQSSTPLQHRDKHKQAGTPVLHWEALLQASAVLALLCSPAVLLVACAPVPPCWPAAHLDPQRGRLLRHHPHHLQASARQSKSAAGCRTSGQCSSCTSSS